MLGCGRSGCWAFPVVGLSVVLAFSLSATVVKACTVNEDCDDDNVCTDDICSGGVCIYNNNTDPCDDGLYCTLDDTCSVGICAGETERDCDDGVYCTTDTCNEVTDQCDSDVDPGYCFIDDVCRTEGFISPANVCEECNPALSATSWSPRPVGAMCGDLSDTDCTDPDTCDGAGTCLANHEPNGTPCDDGLYCNVDEQCVGGVCAGGAARDCGDGIPCTTDTCNEGLSQCESTLDPGYCLIDDVCHTDGDPNPANDCEECATSLSTTSWSYRTIGASCGDSSDTDCTDPDTCDGAGLCLDNHEISGTACIDDGNECTDDVCDGAGVCTHPNLVYETPCTDDGNECTADVCDGSGTCIHPNLADGTACGDLTDDDCTDPDTCDGAGLCLDNHEANGTPCTDDGNECTDDVCDGSGGCIHPDLVDGTPCTDDGNDCTDDVCDGSGACIHPNLAEGAACGDPTDDDCTAPDTCDGVGVCLDNHEEDGTACTDDGNDCTDDVCDGSGVCTHPDLASGTGCGDSSDSDCTDPDTCDGAGVCLGNHEAYGTACTDDGNECTDDVCDGSGSCIHPDLTAGTPCTDDGNECTDDVCQTGTCTHPNLASSTACGDPDDSDCDHPDTCDGSGACLDNLEENGMPCDDGLYCNVDETCSSGLCGGGVGRNCGDGIPCTTNSCNEDADQCESDIDPGYCLIDDNCRNEGELNPTNECEECNTSLSTTGWSFRMAGASCGDPGDTDCTDPDMCDGAGACLPNHEANGTPCDDGLFCNVDEACSNGACVGGWDRDCGDGTPCTTDSCNEDLDQCENDLDAGYCLIYGICYANGEFNPLDDCEHCNTSLSTTSWSFRAFGAPCGSTLNTDCTDPDTCDGAGTCLDNHEVDGTPCSDWLFCNVGEACEMGICWGGGDRDCGDGIPCTADSCNEELDQCDHELDPGFCLINGICRIDGELDPANDCQECDTALSTTAWSYRSAGLACGDQSDTECTDPDTCNGSGVCLPHNVPEGEDCDDSDLCTFNDHCSSGLCVPGDPPGSGAVDLAWVPSSAVLLLGEPIELSLYAFSTDAAPDNIYLIDVVFSWDPDKLELSGFTNPTDVCNDSGTPCESSAECPPGETCVPFWLLSAFPDDSALDGLNYPFTALPANDGDAFYSALARIGHPVPATQEGALIVTFTFNTLEPALFGGTQLDIVACTGSVPTTTRVIRFADEQLQGDLGSATITIAECFISEDCDDSIGCTFDFCTEDNECVIELDHQYCDDGEYCNGAEFCTPQEPGADPVTGCRTHPGSVPDCDDGTVCTMDWCDEVGDVCVHEPDPEHPDCVPCGYGWPPCDDGIYCSNDTCNTALGKCVFTINDDLCDDDGLFCNGEEICDPEAPGADPLGCAHGQAPCPPEECDEENDLCSGCYAPAVEAVGCRYLAITPQHADETTAAFLVTYCNGAVSKYIGDIVDDWPLTTEPDDPPLATLAFLLDDPQDAVYRTPAGWGETVYVTGEDMMPETEYQVQAVCPGSSPSIPVDATYIGSDGQLHYGTWIWGDTAPPPDGLVGLDDIMVLLNAFQGQWDHPEYPRIIPNVDPGPASGLAEECTPDQVAGLADILLVIGAFQGKTYANTYCPNPCSP